MIGIIRSGYSLKLKNFEGPLDLLLELIGNAKLEITEIPISEITDQYLHYINTMQLFNIDIASEFFVMAATLVHIKTKSLLPQKQTEEEEMIDEQELIRRLRDYRRFQHLGLKLRSLKDQGDIYYRRGKHNDPIGIGKSVNVSEPLLGDLIGALLRYKGYFQRKAIPIKRREVNVEQKMEAILTLLSRKKMVLFSEAAKDDESKVDRIASFLGTIELCAKQKVLVRQLKLFADIEITAAQRAAV